MFPKKSLGQNFLIDKNIIKKIINLAKIKNQHVIEIGPGKGSLTEEIIKNKPKSFTIIEKDNFLFQELTQKYINDKKITVINDDILKFNLEKILHKNSIKFLSPNYGRLSIITNYKLDIINKFFVSPNSFFPKPKVMSMVIKFKPKKNKNLRIYNIESLENITNILFSNKRKMINKNIKKILSEKKVKKIKNLNLKKRPAEIRPETYYKITEFYEN